MSGDEYERFEITDYDLENEFNINRPRRRQTKNQQIYGIWADDSENDSASETFSSRRRGLGGSSSKVKDYSAPVSFVAGGVQQAGKKKDKALKGSDHEDQITDDDEDVRPSFSQQHPRLKGSPSPNESNDSSSESEEDLRRGRGNSFKPQSTFQNSNVGSGRNVGAWEQHTRGIGAKLLLQMGYKPGKGLGKDLQGISQPVEAHVRKGRGAIGAYGPEKAATLKGKPQPVKEDDDVREAKEFKEKLNKWKKGADARQDKTKRYYYKSVEEVIEKGKKSNFVLSDSISKKLGNVPVIDMTGPEKRVLSGYHALGSSKIIDEELYNVDGSSANKPAASTAINFAMPELLHNLDLIVHLCERDIIGLDKAEREVKDRQAQLSQEVQNLEEVIRLEKKHMATLDEAVVLVDELIEGGDSLTLERAERIFRELQTNYATEYKEFGLGDLAASVIAPLVRVSLEDWVPLQYPTKNVDTIKKWRAILAVDEESKSETRNVFDPYSSLIWAGVIPSFRECASSWNPKQHQPMAALLDCWAPLFPTWILDSVLEQLVLPRLSAGVREWDPLTDTIPIHMWILPWNSILGEKMEESIFPTIREKLGVALQAWMPQDRSARAMVTPWKGAFDNDEMQMFLLQHIIPKLELVLNEFVINPMGQDLELWNQVWEWHELIPTVMMSQLLDKYFFPKWMQVLVLWLNQSPDYLEISRWYNGWKGMLSEEILREPNVKEYLRRALEIMHRATETLVTPMATIPNMATGASVPVHGTPPPPMPPTLMEMQLNAPAQLEFKELVLQKCSERGILFAPMPGRRELGKQVYRVGQFFCYIDRNVCMISDNSFSNWAPTSLAQLLERASAGVI